MRYLENLNDTSVIKHGDSSETLRLSARNDNEPVTWSEGDVAEVHVDQIGKKVAAKLVVGSNNVLVDSGDLADIPAGKYHLELWVTLKSSGKTAIWPSNGGLEMTIDQNADEVTGDTVTTITLEDFEKRIDSKIAEGLKNIKLDPSQMPSVDLSGYAKKSDVPQVVYDKAAHTLTVNGTQVDIPADVDLSGYAKLSDLPHVDLTPYLTKTDADSKFALKADVPSVKYDKDARTLTVDGQVVSLPASVDLSDYAKSSQLSQYALKSSIPAISLDLAKRTLTLNGVSVTIPESVDLSKYAKSSQVPSVTLSTDAHTLTVDGVAVKIPGDVDLSPYAKSADVTKEIDQKIGSIPAVDLTDYVRKEDVADFARKTDIPVVPEIKLDATKRTLTINGQNIDIPGVVDLSQYAKVDAVPKIALDTEKRTITVNGKSIDVPRDVDLSGYVTKAEMSAEIGKVASGGKIDLTGYVTKADADATYAKKTDVTGMLTKTEADQDYAAKKDVPSIVYDDTTKTLTINGQTVKVPAEVDLSDYAKKSDIKTVDLTPYITTESAEGEFAKKADVPQISYDADKKTLTVNGKKVTIPDSVDLGEYAKKSEIPAPVDLTPYLKSSDADAKYATKSSEPSISYDAEKKTLSVNGQTVELPDTVDLSEYAKKSDIPTIDLTPYIKTADADAKYAVKRDIPQVLYDKDKKTLTIDGQTVKIPENVDLSAYLKSADAETEFAKKSDVPNIYFDDVNNRIWINGKLAADFSQYVKSYQVPKISYDWDDSKSAWILTVNNDKINLKNLSADIPYVVKNVNNNTLTFRQGAHTYTEPLVNYDDSTKKLTVGDQTISIPDASTANGFSLWFDRFTVDTSTTWNYSGHVGYQAPIVNFAGGKNGNAPAKVNPGDILVDGAGKAFSIYGDNGDGNAQLIPIGSAAGNAIQSKDIDDWNAYEGGLNSFPMQYYGKKSIKKALHLEDSKTYTMDLDTGMLVDNDSKINSRLMPGIYQLRDLDTDVSNLTVKSDSNFGGSGGTPVQATVTPYKIEVVLVSGTDVFTVWRSCWLADQGAWYGVTDKWHIEK